MANVLPIFKDGFTPYRQKTHDNESKGSIYDRCFFSYIYRIDLLHNHFYTANRNS